MRDIKFRAWDKVTRKIYHFHNVFVSDDGFIQLDSIDCPPGDKPQSRFEIMQYIGINDKNGKEIYEGDLVVTPPRIDLIGEVVYNPPHFWICPMEYHDYHECKYIDDMSDLLRGGNCNAETHNLDSIKVIGNIYENEELTKEKQ